MESFANRVDAYEERGKFPAGGAQRGFGKIFALVEAVLMAQNLCFWVSAIGKTPGCKVRRTEKKIGGVKFRFFPVEHLVASLVVAVRSLNANPLALGRDHFITESGVSIGALEDGGNAAALCRLNGFKGGAGPYVDK